MQFLYQWECRVRTKLYLPLLCDVLLLFPFHLGIWSKFLTLFDRLCLRNVFHSPYQSVFMDLILHDQTAPLSNLLTSISTAMVSIASVATLASEYRNGVNQNTLSNNTKNLT